MTKGKLNHQVYVEKKCANMYLICECIYAVIKRLPVGWLYLWGLVSLIVLARFRWIFNGLGERGFLEPKRKGGQRENVPSNSHSHRHRHTCTIKRTHRALQQWEERATVTNSFGATKVAGNLSNGTIKLQLSFFSFFIADACILVASSRCTYPSHRRGPCTVPECVQVCVSHILQVH